MNIPFSKYSGAGNDFILIDNRSGIYSDYFSRKFIVNTCHRKFGIGADGILLVESSDKAEVKMRLFNADGSEGEMCGNGLRCFARYLIEIGYTQKDYHIETLSGINQIWFDQENVVTTFNLIEKSKWKFDFSLSGIDLNLSYLNTGVPHIVAFVDSRIALQELSLEEIGPMLRHHPYFSPAGANVNIAYYDADCKQLHVRTFERGVEGETLACGTGSVASALSLRKIYKISLPIQVKVASDDILLISDHTHEDKAILAGPAQFIFSGSLPISQ